MNDSLLIARQALARLRPQLSTMVQETIERRLSAWEQRLQRQTASTATLPALVMRPGLPPRPLNKQYFTIIRAYD